MPWGFTQLNGSLNKHNARTKTTKMKLKEQRLTKRMTRWRSENTSRPLGTRVSWVPLVGCALVKLIQIHQHGQSSTRNSLRKIWVPWTEDEETKNARQVTKPAQDWKSHPSDPKAHRLPQEPLCPPHVCVSRSVCDLFQGNGIVPFA